MEKKITLALLTVESLDIFWPSGQMDCLTNLSIDRMITVKEDVGLIPRPFLKISSPK
jgi:hypothetical protein